VTDLPKDVEVYKRTATFTAASAPAAIQRDHKTRAGVWGCLVVEEGALTFQFAGEEAMRVGAGERVAIPPEKAHAVTPDDDARFHVEFLRAPTT
jgi:tellurite resistance-related uncharacterized protein